MNKKIIFKKKAGVNLLLSACILFNCLTAFAQAPYNIVMNLYGDPATQISFNWLCDAGIANGKVEIIGVKTVNAACTQNTGFTENKAVVTGLSPNTTYSFKVCNNSSCSSTGTFTTAKANKEPFSFVYLTDAQVDYISQLQTNTNVAFTNCPNANFWLHCGDHVENGASLGEWNDFFNAQQYWFLRKPFASIIGNHDALNQNINNCNFPRLFNIDNFGTSDPHKSTYTYIYGDAQFFAINSELYNNTTYINNVKTWMQDSVNAHQDIKWRIVYFHKCAYSGTVRQTQSDCIQWRQAMTPLFDELNIDIAFFGHDHNYQVIGPVKNKQLVQGAVSNVQPATQNNTTNMTGKSGGIFNVKEGTLYFSNGTIGSVYHHVPLTRTQMDAGNGTHGITNYFDLFTGRLGQIGKPTYSNISVSSDNIVITTYEVDPATGRSSELDKITVVKYCEDGTLN